MLEDYFVAGGFKDFLFSPRKLGKISILTNIFQMDWNHQPDKRTYFRGLLPLVLGGCIP